MSVFSRKKLVVADSIGDKLRQAREALGLSLGSVANQIQINKKYLEAIENNDWHVLPGEVYSKNFLKVYVEFLRLDWGEFDRMYEDNKDTKTPGTGEKLENISLRKSHLVVLPRVLRNVVAGVVVVIVLVYVAWGIFRLTQAPQVDIMFPPDNFTTLRKKVKIQGWVSLESELKINGQVVGVDTQGYFIEDIDLVEGLNIVKFEAKKRRGKIRMVEWKIMVEDSKSTDQ